MTHLAPEPDHARVPTVVRNPQAGPNPVHEPSAPVPLPIIRRVMDGPAMKLAYLCENADVLGSNALNTLFENNVAAVTTLLDSSQGGGADKMRRAGGIRELAAFLLAGGEGEVVQRWTLLDQINTKLARKYLQVTKSTGQVTTSELQRWDAAIDAHASEATFWGSLPSKRVVKWDLILPKIDPTALIPATVLTAIQTHGKASNPHLGLVATKLQELYDTYPPGATLVRGGLDWGPTPDSSADVNKSSHVRKHFINDGSATITPDPDEHWEWMTRTGVKFTRAEVETLLGTPVTEPGIFEAGSETVETKPQAQKFFRSFLPANKALANALLTKYGDRYLDAVRAAAATMTDITVTVIGNSILLVGQSNEIFIAGRWQPASRTFTISSGYINPAAKWAENQNFKIWPLADG